jgi:hypothetical protein
MILNALVEMPARRKLRQRNQAGITRLVNRQNPPCDERVWQTPSRDQQCVLAGHLATRAVLHNRNDMNENGGRSYQFPKDMWFRPPETEEKWLISL